MLGGNRAAAERVMQTAEAIAHATGLSDLFARQVPALPPPSGDTAPVIPLGIDTARR